MVQGQKYHMLYKTTCTVTGNFYIGVHSTTNPEDGYLGSGMRLGNSIQKHGKENHKREILELFETREDLMKREREVVNEQLLLDTKCMNLKPGGEGGASKELLKKMHAGASKWMRSQWSNEEFASARKKDLDIARRKNAAEGKFKRMDWNGKKHSPETIQKFRESRSITSRGEKNSMHGKIWVFNDIERKSMPIEKASAESLIAQGWKIGRKKYGPVF